jgi:hypothetical protein
VSEGKRHDVRITAMKYRFRLWHIGMLVLLTTACAVILTAIVLCLPNGGRVTYENYKMFEDGFRNSWTRAEAESILGRPASTGPYRDRRDRDRGTALVWHTQARWPEDDGPVKRKVHLAFDNDGKLISVGWETESTTWETVKYWVAKWWP